jgi:hypothetical protein
MALKASDAYAITTSAYKVKAEQLDIIYKHISEKAGLGYDCAYMNDIYQLLDIKGSKAMLNNLWKSICTALKAEGYKISKNKISWKV